MARPTDLIGTALYVVVGAALSFLVEKFQQRIGERTDDLVQASAALRLDESRLQTLLCLSEMAQAPEQQVTDFALEEAIRLTGSEIGYLAFMTEDEMVLTMHAWSKTAMAQCAIEQKPVASVVANVPGTDRDLKGQRPSPAV
jgi:hypothetical protein